MHGGFIHLRVHTSYSLTEGAIGIDELISLCERNSMPAVAITDTGNLFGVLEFSLACAVAGVQPLIGTVLSVSFSSKNSIGPQRNIPSVVLLAQNELGYSNLIKLSSHAFISSNAEGPPKVFKSDLERYSKGLICLTGGPNGPVNKLLTGNQHTAAKALLVDLEHIFPGRLYIELQRHGADAEDRIEGLLIELAYSHGLPLVATNDVFFSDSSMQEAHDALICISDGTYLNQSDRRRYTSDHRFKSAAEMRSLFSDLPEAVSNTIVIAQRCAFRPLERDPIFPKYISKSHKGDQEELRDQAAKGLASRLELMLNSNSGNKKECSSISTPYFERLEYELSIIIKMGFAGYFLIVADFIGHARKSGVPVGPGRGSGAGSVVAWALGITDIDPLKFGLLFERFLNPERISMPDFDIDFCQDRRDEILRYVEEKYGRNQVAQIITFGKLQARAALRDVGRVLELPYSQVDRICKMVPNNPANPTKLAEAIIAEPELQHMQATDENIARLLDIALKLEGLHRHASTHAAGVVIGDRPLEEMVPLYSDPRSNMLVTQFSMKFAELAGLVKFDFLGLKTLTVLEKTRELLLRRGISVNLAQLPLDDSRTFQVLGCGETVGVFQLESAGMRQVLLDMKPDTFEDIIALVALYRPGPMENIPRYVSCKKGEEKPEQLHPMIEPILNETYGVIIYQEQVMEIAKVLSGYSLGDADVLRRAMGKKIKSEMDSQREKFVDGAIANGVERARASQIFDLLAKFAGYGFNKSHAACYALIAYQTAWLKANYPVEFLAASMTLELGNTDKLSVFKKEAERLGIEIHYPDINTSEVEFSVDYDVQKTWSKAAILYALAAIKNVGRQAMEHIVLERKDGGKFSSLTDFVSRVAPPTINKRQLENLVQSGALDSLNANRAQTFLAIELLLRHSANSAESRNSGQKHLFSDNDHELPDLFLPNTEEWSATERLQKERDAVGFYLSSHPLEIFDSELKRLKITTFKDTRKLLKNDVSKVRLAGTVEGIQERTSARGNRYAFLELSDISGGYEVAVFPELLGSIREVAKNGTNVVVTVEGHFVGDTARLTAQSVQSLEEVIEQATVGLTISVKDASGLKLLRKVLNDCTDPGSGRVNLILSINDGSIEIEVILAETFTISRDLRESVAHTPGVVSVIEI